MNEVREHVADGIEEYDNPLPRWWLHLFYATIAFAAVYAMLYPSLWSWNGTLSWSSASQYDTQVAGAPSRHVAKAATDLETLARNPDVVAAGKSIFMTTCAMCHGDNGEGRVGPRLTDSTWKYGGDASTRISFRVSVKWV
jgi:cytochrome c oxidase cbb3-type subunit 3